MPPPPAFTEESRRRPTLDLSDEASYATVEMADGKGWHLPRPRVRFVPFGTEFGFGREMSLGPEFDAIMRRWHAARKALQEAPVEEDGRVGVAAMREIIASDMALAVFLLRYHYDLSDDDCNALVRFGYDDREDPCREAIYAVALGLDGPKPRPDTPS